MKQQCARLKDSVLPSRKRVKKRPILHETRIFPRKIRNGYANGLGKWCLWFRVHSAGIVVALAGELAAAGGTNLCLTASDWTGCRKLRTACGKSMAIQTHVGGLGRWPNRGGAADIFIFRVHERKGMAIRPADQQRGFGQSCEVAAGGNDRRLLDWWT